MTWVLTYHVDDLLREELMREEKNEGQTPEGKQNGTPCGDGTASSKIATDGGGEAF